MLEALPHDTLILDGEATGGWGRQGKADYNVFDVLWIDGRDVRPLPLDERRAILKTLRFALPVARVAALTGDAPWERACREGWEGVIAKRRDSPYEGKRSKAWLKMKCEASQELVVGGFTDPQGSRVGLGALLVGYFDGDDFVFAGKIGTGFDNALLRDLRARLDALERTTSPFTRATGLPKLRVHWVTPADRRPGRVHRVDRRRQAAPPAPARPARRQGGARRGAGAAMTSRQRRPRSPSPIPRRCCSRTTASPRADVAAYYAAVAAVMLPHVRGRPVTMERFPSGIDAKGFLQKNVVKGFPAWLERAELPKKDGTVFYPLAGDARSLQWMANQNTVTLHVWPSRMPHPIGTRRLRLRSRSGRATIPSALRAAALGLRDLLAEREAAQRGEDVGLEGLPHRRAAEARAGAAPCPASPHGDRRRADRAAARSRDAGVQQGRSRRPHPRRHRPQPAGGDDGGGLHAAGATRRAGVGAVHVGGDRRAAPSARARSRCGRWRRGSTRSATCGRISPAAASACPAVPGDEGE